MSKKVVNEINDLLKESDLNGLMRLSQQIHREIQGKTKTLNFAERAKLMKLFYISTGTCLLDVGSIFKTEIYIDDQNTELTKDRPLAYVNFSDGINSRVEVVDILASVRNDAIAIGHPVILAAINHWQNLLVWEKFSRKQDKTTEDEIVKSINHIFNDKFLDNAKANLKAIGKAMLESTRKNVISKEVSLTLKIKELDRKDTYLYVAWDRLKEKYIVDTEELKKRITRIKEFLGKLLNDRNSHLEIIDGKLNLEPEINEEHRKYGQINSVISIDNVISFLEDAGSKYVYDEHSDKSPRPRWKVFKNAFISWFFKKKISTIEIYRGVAKKQKLDDEPYTPIAFGVVKKIDVFDVTVKTYTSSLATVCPAIKCPSHLVNSREFRELLTQALTK